MKKRYIAGLALIVVILLSCPALASIAPVRPFIQLPGEVYPGTEWFFGGWTNTWSATLLAFVVTLILTFSLRARSRTADEVPTGFYNFFEMVIEGAYGFAENIAGAKKVKDFFPFFMTYIIFILIANWFGLVPGFDSIGIWEYKPHFFGLQDVRQINGRIDELGAGDPAALDEYLEGLAETYHLEHSLEIENGHLTHESEEELLHAIEHEIDLENKGDLRNGVLLQRAPVTVDEDGNEIKPDDADWTIVPYFRPAATDINFTLAFAIVAMIAVQFFGFKYLGVRGYLSKFFPFISPGFFGSIGSNPIKAIDPVVGLLELVSEVSKIISFTFRLLGNIFAGMVLLFVMSALVPAANIAFFGLEFFVGLIQAMVFALLMLIFMTGATESHHGDEEHH